MSKTNFYLNKNGFKNSFKLENWLFPGTHLEICNLPEGSLESVSESSTDFVRIRIIIGV